MLLAAALLAAHFLRSDLPGLALSCALAPWLLVTRRRWAIGALAAWLGQLSPWRVRIGEGCDRCGRCRLVCRYDALNTADIERGRPGISCTLCGDCLASCEEGYLHYTCPGLSPARARAAFVALTVALHAATLRLARI